MLRGVHEINLVALHDPAGEEAGVVGCEFLRRERLDAPEQIHLHAARGGDEFVVEAHVLSQTEHDGNVLIYDGVVRDFYSKADGTISYIVLRDARRGVLKISDEVSKAAPARNRLSDNELSEALGGLLVLTSNDIANVYLERLSQVQSGSADEALLTERLNQLEAPAHDDSFSLD